MTLLIWVHYIISIALTLIALKRIKTNSLRFLDGILVGSIYYITIPMFFILQAGEVTGQFMNAPAFRPFEHINTTILIFFGVDLVCALKIFTPATSAPRPKNRSKSISVPLALVACIFIATTTVTFFMSGLHEGGHWARNTDELMQSNGLFVLLRYLSNFSRMAVFGVLLYAQKTGRIQTWQLLAAATFIVLTDMFLTFNRITAVYFIITIFFLLEGKIKTQSILATILVLFVPFLSNMWPVFRGLATANGYSVGGMMDAFYIAFDHNIRAELHFVEYMNGVFESINIVALNYVVQHTGDTIPIQLGTTYLLRPLTFFLPTSIWPGRPPVFGMTLGETIQHVEGLALNSTLFGEVYANFAGFWPVFFVLVIVIYDRLYGLIATRAPHMGPVGMLVGVAAWRFDASFTVVAMVLCLLFMAAENVTSQWLRASGKPQIATPIGQRAVNPKQKN